MQWIAAELDELKCLSRAKGTNLQIHIYVTQEAQPCPTSSSSEIQSTETDEKAAIEHNVEPIKAENNDRFSVTYLDASKPSLRGIVQEFMNKRAEQAYRTRVIASGPASMGIDLRDAVARENDGGRVWKARGGGMSN